MIKVHSFKINWGILAILLTVVIITYWMLILTFYQQDEWIAVGQFLTGGLLAQTSTVNPILLLLGSNRVLAHPVHMLIYTAFPLQIWPFFLFGIFFQTVNSYMVFLLSKKVTKNQLISFLASLFFAIGSTGNQAVSWAAASTTTLPAAFFCFVSLYFFLNFLEFRLRSQIIISFCSLVVAYLFKESSIFILVVFIVSYFLFRSKGKAIDFKNFLPFVAYFAVAVLVRIADMLTSVTNPIGKMGTDSSVFLKAAFFVFVYPFSAISQYFVPLREMFSFSRVFERINYPFIYSTNYGILTSERIVAEMLSLVLSLLIVIFFIIVWFNYQKLRKVILFSFVFMLSSILPFVIIERGSAYLESRYYYMGAAGAGMLLGISVFIALEYLKKINSIPKLFRFTFIGLVLAIFFSFQINSVYRDFSIQIELAKQRKKFIQEVLIFGSKLPDKPVIYITGDQIHYGPNQYVPFQQGLGYTLMVLFYSTEKIPGELISEEFLWNVGSQGYMESGEKAFGYFGDYGSLEDIVDSGEIDPEQIIAFEYLTKNGSLSDITQRVRSSFVKN